MMKTNICKIWSLKTCNRANICIEDLKPSGFKSLDCFFIIYSSYTDEAVLSASAEKCKRYINDVYNASSSYKLDTECFIETTNPLYGMGY